MSNLLIDRQQNFVLNSKILSIDSDDRDITKWPNPANFEIRCPQSFNNVESIRLMNVNTPNNFYNISNYLQNNKLLIRDNTSRALAVAAGAASIPDDTLHIIDISDGKYNIEELMLALNTQTSNYSIDISFTYNNISNKINVTHNSFKKYILDFTVNLSYNSSYFYDNNNNTHSMGCTINIYEQHSNWGLGYMLGFNKQKYNVNNLLEPPNQINLNLNNFIYLEIDKLNRADEIKPFLTNNRSNENNGIVNSFFAKIPIIMSEYNQNLTNKDNYVNNLCFFQPPIDNLSKLKFKFRYHNGLLIDLNNHNISLTLEINQINNELKNYNVRQPFLN